jgi:hypothetical protein
MLRRQRVADAILAQVVADAHLATETVASLLDSHAGRIVGKGVDKYRHVKASESYCVRDGSFVAKVWQRHYYSVYLVTVLFEYFSA